MYKLGILGIGNMGGSILEGILKASLYKKEDVFLYDPNTEIKEKYSKLGLCFACDEKDLIENAQMLLLAIKPQMLDELKKYRFENNNLLIISIVAGKTKQKIEEIFGKQKIIRVMPNTPSLIKYGATAVGSSKEINETDLKKVVDIFSSIGTVEVIPDELMNEIIPVNGSMPAFLYYFAKCFIDKAVKDGIDYEVAKNLASQAIIGSAKMIKESGKDIDTLIKNVCSPKGATLEGLKVFEENNMKKIIEDASDATIKRAYELSNI